MRWKFFPMLQSVKLNSVKKQMNVKRRNDYINMSVEDLSQNRYCSIYAPNRYAARCVVRTLCFVQIIRKQNKRDC